MRLIMTIIWSLLISSAISYVLTSMAGDPFNFTHTVVLTIIFVVAIVALSEGALNESKH